MDESTTFTRSAHETPDARTTFEEALHSAQLTPVTYGTPALEEQNGVGSVLTRLWDREARRHYENMQVILNREKEVRLGNSCVTVIAAHGMVAVAGAEEIFKDTLVRQQDNELFMSGYPVYVNLFRGHMIAGITRITQAGVDHVSRRVEQR